MIPASTAAGKSLKKVVDGDTFSSKIAFKFKDNLETFNLILMMTLQKLAKVAIYLPFIETQERLVMVF